MSLVNSFDTHMGASLVTALSMGMGDDVTLKGKSYKAVVEVTEAGSERGAKGGRRTVIQGRVTMKLEDWIASGAVEGDSINLPDGQARITATPTLTASTAQFRVEGLGA